MADIYKFNVTLKGVSGKIWREIELTSVSSVAKLGYAVLAAFESVANHLFYIRYNGNRYEIMFEEEAYEFEHVMNPIKMKLNALNLSIGDVLEMEYDYGAEWCFDIKLVSISEMKRGTGNHYPYVTAGQGRGIIEDASPYDLEQIIRETDATGKLPEVYDYDHEKVMKWDYRVFDLKYCNAFFKDFIFDIQCAYERY